MKNHLILFLAVAWSPFLIQAQWSLGINAKVYDPKGAFNTNVEGVAGGISFKGLRTTEGGRLSYGGELGVAMYSVETYDLEVNGGIEEVTEEDCFWTVHGVAQYTVYQNEFVRSYTEVRVGLTNFFSSILPTNEYSDYSGEFRSHGTAFNTGFGGGAAFNLGRIFKGEPNGFNIDLGVNLHSGSATNYRDRDSVDQPLTLESGMYRSLTTYVGYRLGLMVDL